MKYCWDILERECDALHILLAEEQKEQFFDFYKILIEWNQVMNLTAITEFQDVLLKHFADSLSIVRILDLNQIKTVIDVGTGAGFPGIPLKIMFPHLHITLLDSLKKRTNFLKEVCGQVNLSHVEILHGRAEDFARQKKYRESYDLCVSRAVANLSVLSEYCLPYICESGYFVPYKSMKAEEEMHAAEYALKVLGGKLEKTCNFHLNGEDLARSLLLIRKISKTPGKYPRKAGLPSREPLRECK